MASAQQQKRESKTCEREEHNVPKLASHFEALVDKTQGGGDCATISTTTTTISGTCPTRGAAAPIVEEAQKVLRRMELKDTETGTHQGRGHHEKGGRTHFESISDKITGDRCTGQKESGMASQEKQRMAKTGDVQTHGRTREAQTHGLSSTQGKQGEAQTHGLSSTQGRQGVQKQGHSTQGGTRDTQKQGFSKQGRTEESQKQGSAHEVGKYQVKHEERNKDQESRITPSLEDISGYRQSAQQNSAEAIRAAEERYSKAKDLAAHEAKESASHGLGAAATYASHLGSKAKDQTLGGIQYVSEKAAPVKDTAVETAQRGYVSTKETVAGAGQTAADYTKTAAQKAGETGMTVAEKAVETGKTVGSKAMETGMTVGSKAVETGKTVGVKAVEAGQTVGGKAVEVAAEVKDTAVVAGWGTAQYAGEMAVGATRMAAGLVKGVAGATANTAAAAKDVVVDMGKKTTDYVEDTAVYAGETVVDFASRKREEAKHDLEAKKREGQAPLSNLVASEEKSSYGRISQSGGGGAFSTTKTSTTEKMSSKGSTESSEEEGGMVNTIVEEGGGVLGAIGETIAEIAQGVVAPPPIMDPTTKEGQDKASYCQTKCRSEDVYKQS